MPTPPSAAAADLVCLAVQLAAKLAANDIDSSTATAVLGTLLPSVDFVHDNTNGKGTL